MPATARAQVYTCWRNSLSAFAAANTGHAEIATMMAKKQRFNGELHRPFAGEIRSGKFAK